MELKQENLKLPAIKNNWLEQRHNILFSSQIYAKKLSHYSFFLGMTIINKIMTVIHTIRFLSGKAQVLISSAQKQLLLKCEHVHTSSLTVPNSGSNALK